MTDKEIVLESTDSYLKSLISEVAQLSIGDNDASTPFQELGIDSFRVLQIIKKLEEEFGTLPKTLLFENFNISDLSHYFINKHEMILAEKFAKGKKVFSTSVHSAEKPVKVISKVVAHQTNKLSRRTPILLLEEEAYAHPEWGKLVKELFDQYKNEGSASRGTRNIAPNLFVGSEKRGYFNYSRSENIILVYTYTGPKDYFPVIAEEMYQYCTSHGFELNLFTSEQIQHIGGVPFSATPFGVLSRIENIKDFTLRGGKMRRLRYQVSKFEEAGKCRIEEYHNGSDKEIDQNIVSIIDEWCAPRTMVNPLIYIVKEEILAGRLSTEHRLFITYLDDVLQNVILISKLSPEENGYLMDLEFYPQCMPLGGLEFAIIKIIGILAAEGCNMLSLGGTYGCKLAPSSNADPALDKTLDYLREQDIFNDEGNLQFKNKFRPEHTTVFLCRAVGNNPDNVTDIIMMIADPTKMQTSGVEHQTSPQLPQPVVSPEEKTERQDTPTIAEEINLDEKPSQPEKQKVMTEGTERSVILSDFSYNPLNIPDDKVEFDLKTDSWAQLEMPAIQNQMRFLRAQLQQPVDLEESLRGVFPFSYFALTTSGRTAERAFFKAWSNKGIVLQNLLFPTTIFHQIDNGFTPQELPHAEVFQLDSKEIYKGNLDWEALQERVEQDPTSIAFVLMEVGDNAAGGAPVSMQHIKKVKTLLSRYSIPLVFDGCRILENAQFIIGHEKEFAGKNCGEVVREIFSHADAVIASLAKDFCVNKGGLIATNDASLFRKLQDLIREEGIGLDVIDKKVIALSLQYRSKIETQILQRMESVRLIGNALKKQGIPVVQPVGGHCILIDVKQVKEFTSFKHPVASFVAWMYMNTGIRAGSHNAGMQKNTSLNNLVRLAIPVGIKRKQIEVIIDRLILLFERMENIPELLLEGNPSGSLGDVYATFKLVKYHNVSGKMNPKPFSPTPSSTHTTSPKKPSVSDFDSKEAGLSQSTFSKKSNQSRDIAIIGMAGRYPKAKNINEFWDNLIQGRDCIETIPDVRFNQRFPNEFSEKYRGGFIDDVDKFDSLFFNISPREAEHLDPQERLFLEVAWEAIEDAGYYPETLAAEEASRNIGVFVGAVWTLYQMLGVEEKFKGNNLNPSSHLWGIANRVSYAFNLSGPSLTLDTACSSSLTALYLACEAINNGECTGAMVGGVNLDVHQSKIDINNGGGALSEDGVCRTFGKGANGYVAGEGVGALFLKPLGQAVKDGDNIYGVIKGIAVNHGGKTSGFMVPSPHAQAKVVTTALENANLDARSVSYIEAHGTGTELGDPIEISGLTKAFEKYHVDKESCSIGSVKTNIGHLEAAAGIVGIHKILLQMKHRKLVPSLHSSELNPFIDFENSPFYVEQTVEEWKPKVADGLPLPLCAGISSFGAGGSNAHVLIEQYNSLSQPQTLGSTEPTDQLFPLSARNEDQLREAAIRLRTFLQQELVGEAPFFPLNARDIAHTLRIGRKSFDHRLAIVAKTKEELVEKLSSYIEGEKDDAILAGQAKNSEGITRLLSHNEKEEFIKLLAQSGDLRKLAQLWIEGFLSDWQVLVLETGKKVSLPTYPFADKRHWISDTTKTTSLSLPSRVAIHPLIDSNESTFECQIFKKTFHDKEFVIYDHLVSAIPTLPGVAYLDLVRKAGELAAGRKVQKIRNILWLSPLTVVNSQPTEAFIELKPNGDLVQFEVFSEREDGQKQLHSQGKISYATRQDTEAEPEYIDLEGIRGRCVKVMDGKEAYAHFKSLGLDLGPSFQVLQEVSQNEDEILGLLTVPEARQGDFQDFLLHPSLMDGTGQTGMAAQLAENKNGSSGEMFVPYSFGEVEILHPVPPRCFAYVKKANKPSAKVTRTNILVVDESGKIVVKIKDSVGVPLVSVHEKPEQDRAPDEFSTLYYAPVWEKSPLLNRNGQSTYDSLVLFDTDEKLRQVYQTRLQEAGQDVSQVILVKPGDSYQDLGEQTYTINPRNREDFTQLFGSLNNTTLEIGKICFAWPSHPPKGSEYHESVLKDLLEKGVYSFLFLCQALVEQKYNNTIQLLYLYSSKKGEPQPHHDAMSGFVKTLHIEHPKLSTRILKIQQQVPDVNKIIDIVRAEFHQHNLPETTVRYHEQERYVRKLTQYTFEETGDLSSAQGVGLKEKGVYLITGGTGGLGLIFAAYLAKEYKARLILTGRSKLSAEREAQLEELRRSGAEVRYFPADVSNAKEVKNLIEETKSQFGAINGIIHSAGVLRDSYLRNKTPEEMEAVLAPKLYGSLHLDAATQHEELDFFVLFSSMAAVSGNMGQCDYSFANNFLDSFAARREQLKAKGERAGKTLSLNWSIWAKGGMRLDEQMEIYFKKNLGISPLRTETGLTAFTKALSQEESQLAVVEGAQEKIELAWGLRKEESPVASSSGRAQPPTSSESGASTTDKELVAMVQDELSQIVMDFLKLDADDISVDKILMDLGFDSIGLATFANAMNDEYKLDDVTPVLFFEYPSIKEIAQFLCAEHEHEMRQYHQASPVSVSGSTAPQATVQPEKAKHFSETSIGFKKGWNSNAFDSVTNRPTSNVNFSAERRFIDMPIAIVGMSGVMPQADDLEEYWEKLKNAENNMVTEVPEDRWRWEDYYGDPFEGKNKTKIKWGGFMREVDRFDPLFWGISPREAAMMDPQQRIFLEMVWKAIEDSGHKVSDLSGTKTGIFVGAATRDYIDLMGSLEVELDGYSGSGTSHAVLANRVSYLLNLHGPSAPLDTACSSSLVALHRAIESIHTGSCDMAIVGGVQVMLTPAGHISFGAAGMLSEDGKCKTFDERANGYVRGEGSGAIFIKPLSKAEADGDHIYAVIKATAENHGGKVTVLTAPNPGKQAELLVDAYEKAEIDPTTVGYIECHGTGTSLGDPIELQALKKAFSELYKRHNKGPVTTPHIGLTSAKTNIGHLETAAGIAGILKVLLSLKHGQIPALLHFEKLNPYIKLEGTPFYMVDKTQPWEAIKGEDGTSLPRRAGVSSFGFGGANVHVILEEYVSSDIQPLTDFEGPYLIVLSAKNEERLKTYARLMLAHIEQQEIELADIAYTLQVGRDAMTVRLGFIANSVDELVEKLGGYIDGTQTIEATFHGKVAEKNRGSAIDDHTINGWFRDKSDARLLEAWVNGLDLDWNKLYDHGKPKRVSLPTYPFAREKHWFRASSHKPIDTVGATIAVLHPLMHTNTSDLSRQSYRSTFHGEEFFINDYQYKGQKVLPAVAYLEMARVAIDLATPALQKSSVLELHNMACEDSIVIDQNKQVTIALFVNDDEQIEFEIYCADQEQEVVHCVGQAQFVDGSTPGSLAIQKLLGQMQPRNIDDLYVGFARMGLNYGESFKGITAIYQTDQQILAQLAIPDALADSQHEYLLHPSLMDSVVQASVGLLTDFRLSELSSPPSFTLDSLSIVSAGTKSMYVWIRFAQDYLPDEAIRLDIDLCDQQGNICVQMRGFSIPQLSVRIDYQAKQNRSITEDTFRSPVASKPKQIKLAGLQEVSAPLAVEHPIASINVPQRPVEPTAEPLEINPAFLGQETDCSQRQLYKASISSAEEYDYPNPRDAYQTPLTSATDVVANKQSSHGARERTSQEQLQRQLAASLAEALYLNAADIEVEKSFIDLGLDSIVGVEWLGAVNKRYGIAIPASVVYDYPTVKQLAAFLHQEVNVKENIMQAIEASSTSVTSY